VIIPTRALLDIEDR